MSARPRRTGAGCGGASGSVRHITTALPRAAGERHERRPPSDRGRRERHADPPEQPAGDERGEVVAHRPAAEPRPEHLHHVERADGQQARQDQPLQRPAGDQHAEARRQPREDVGGTTSALAQISVRRRPQRSDSGPQIHAPAARQSTTAETVSPEVAALTPKSSLSRGRIACVE